MRKRLAIVLAALTGLGVLGLVPRAAEAHTCDPNTDECEDTPVMENWRDQYVPVFGLEDREDEQQRYDAQRWRDECDNQQQCAWAEGGNSATGGSPNELHVGYAATHCFLGEAAHQCEDHTGSGDPDNPNEGVHDAHGGALYADVCLAQNNDPTTNKWCDDGVEDTQVGVTIMDHFGCGIFVPIASCTDEYHVVRPADEAYTNAQMEDTAAAPGEISGDPASYICGNHVSGASCRNNVNNMLDLLGL
jgi:hypothetical protein